MEHHREHADGCREWTDGCSQGAWQMVAGGLDGARVASLNRLRRSRREPQNDIDERPGLRHRSSAGNSTVYRRP